MSGEWQKCLLDNSYKIDVLIKKVVHFLWFKKNVLPLYLVRGNK